MGNSGKYRLFKSMVYLKDKLRYLESQNKKKEKQIINNKFEKIHWTGTELQLIILFEQLVENKLIVIQPKPIYKFISEYFENKFGNEFDPNQLAKATKAPLAADDQA